MQNQIAPCEGSLNQCYPITDTVISKHLPSPFYHSLIGAHFNATQCEPRSVANLGLAMVT